jgi:uncharacterized NAD(P)/FAD-binding protein YdhS
MEATKFRIGIIGGGSIAVSFLSSLAIELMKNSSSTNIEILMFDPQRELGSGCYWTSDVDSNILNTRADAMSVIEGDKLHFLKWLKNNKSDWKPHFPNLTVSPDAYLPRSLFGKYLHDVYEKSVSAIQTLGVKFTHIADEVTDTLRMMDGLCLDTKSSGAFEVNHIVLCMGNLPSTLFTNFQGITGYHHNPYPSRHLITQIQQDDSVCVIGTSLSAIDSIVSLVESGHRGKIVCISRNGRFPSVRGGLTQRVPLKAITREKIDSIVKISDGKLKLTDIKVLLVEEIERIEGKKFNLAGILNSEANVFDYLDAEIELSSTTERVWQSVVYATNNIIDYIWHRLDTEDKRTFYKLYRGLWLRYRVSFPLQNSIKLKSLIKTDQLSVFSGFQEINYENDKKSFAIRFNCHQRSFESTVITKHVINATCFSMDVESTNVPLIKNLLRRQFATANEFGGFEVDYETGMLIYPNGIKMQDFSVLGSLTNGVYFWTNAFDVNVRIAARQAKNLGIKIAQLELKTTNQHRNIVPPLNLNSGLIPKIDSQSNALLQ